MTENAYETPLFNLKAVVQETGVAAGTLRAWERRYDLPQPDRTRGGHRLYSRRDIDLIKWLVERQQEGMNIRRAVALWRRLASEGREPLPPTSRSLPVPVPAGETLTDLRQSWIAACHAFDEQAAERVLAQAFALYPPETVCLEILRAGLSHIGHSWYTGETSVQQEHFASRLATRHVEALLMASPPPMHTGRILVACAPEEEHAFGLLLLALLLRRRGREIVYLGSSVPTTEMSATVTATQPRLAILAAYGLPAAATMLNMARFLLQEHELPVTFGGWVFNQVPALRERIPGIFLGEKLDTAVGEVERLLVAPPSLPPVDPPSARYEQALAHYRGHRGLVEAAVWRTFGNSSGDVAWLNRELARNIEAALRLEDIQLMNAYMDWLRGLECFDCPPAEWIERYLRVYYKAARAHLYGPGSLIPDWLAEHIAAGPKKIGGSI